MAPNARSIAKKEVSSKVFGQSRSVLTVIDIA